MSTEDSSLSQPKNTNGVKLPYFHRTLSEEDKSLIGDTTPKPIQPDSSISSNTSSCLTTASPWNAASTWEERNCTKWAISFLPTIFGDEEEVSIKSYGQSYDFSVTEVTNVKGNAQITHSRGKIRYLYELSFDLSFRINTTSSSSSEYTGTLNVNDIIVDLLDDIELSIEWKNKPPSNTFTAFQNVVSGSEVRKLIITKMRSFETEYRKI